MTKFLFGFAFFVGAFAILWIGRIFLGADIFGFCVTILIGGVYLIGTWELLLFRRETGSLKNALGDLDNQVEEIKQWLLTLSPSLQNAVRLRIDGEHNNLPAPVITPFLVGLLVMLGLLGTFIGMVDTLNGAVVALEGDSELEAIRAGLAAPIEGLGLAFGTSVAGVAGSAMLGLLSTISRRERVQVSYLLDTKVGNELKHLSVKYQQQLVFKSIQEQAHLMPAVAEKLTTLATGLEAMTEDLGQKLLASQTEFQSTVTSSYQALNDSVVSVLTESLSENEKLIRTSIQPMAEKSLSKLNQVANETQQQLVEMSQQQLGAFNETVQTNSEFVKDVFDSGLKQQESAAQSMLANMNSSVEQVANELQKNSQKLLDGVADKQDQLSERQQANATQFNDVVQAQIKQLRADESKRTDAAIERLGELESVVATHLKSLGQSLEEPMTRLIETASQTPKAAADVIEKLRGEMSKNIERDNGLLEERIDLMKRVESLSDAVEKSTAEQHLGIVSLMEDSTSKLEQVTTLFSDQLKEEVSKLAGAADYFASGGIEISGLGEAFAVAVSNFSDSNNMLIENLTRIETALEKSNNRSDEQLNYYVAQAREVIDHNLLSHKEILDAVKKHLKAAVDNGAV